MNKADESWKSALEMSGLGIWEWHVPGNKFLYSQKLDEMLGLHGESAPLPGWMELVHPEDRQRAGDHLEGILRGKEQKAPAEYRVRCADGTHKLVRVTGFIKTRGIDKKPVSVVGLIADLSDQTGHMVARIAAGTVPTPISIIQEGRARYVNPLRDVTGRKKRDEALRESERKFRDLVEKSLVGVYLIQDGLFRYVNSRFAEILGYKAHELIETVNCRETILPEDRPAVLDRIRKRESGEIRSMHHAFRIVTKEGEVRNVEVYGTRTMYRGRPAVIGTLLDVTERIRAEERYRAIFENAVEGIFQTSSSHVLMEVNESLVKTFGYETAEEFMAGMKGRERGLFVHSAQHREFFRRIHEEGYVRGFEAEQYRKDGRRIWVSFNLTPIRAADGTVLRHVGTLVDITERKAAEERLSRSEAGLRALIGSINDVIALVDKNGRYTRLDLKNPDVLNPSHAGRFDKKLEEVIPPENVSAYLAAVRKALRTRRTVNIEYRIGAEGNGRWYSTAISPMAKELTVSVARDITGLKMAEAELRAKSLSLEETNSALRVLLSNMEEAKKELEDNVVSNIRVLVMPHVKRLGRRNPAGIGKADVDAIETGLKSVASPFLRNLSQFGLTPTEMQVAGYVRDGRTTKEIIELMRGTKDSIDMHRYHIRKKLGINRTKANLRSHLLSLH